MPEKKTTQRARKAEREGKAPTTQAGEFVREEIEHVREGKHGARSPQQAIAIGLSKARRAGVKLPPPKKGRASPQTQARAERDLEKGQSGQKKRPSAKRSQAVRQALKREGRSAGSRQALSAQAKKAAAERRKRGPATERAGGARKTAGKAAAKKPPAKTAGKKSTARKAPAKNTARSAAKKRK